MRQRRLTAPRVNLQEGIQKARPLILSEVKVTALEVRKAKKKKGKKFTEFAREKTEEESMDQCISQEAKMNNDIKKKPSLSD